jgi:hypothetical protein
MRIRVTDPQQSWRFPEDEAVPAAVPPSGRTRMILRWTIYRIRREYRENPVEDSSASSRIHSTISDFDPPKETTDRMGGRKNPSRAKASLTVCRLFHSRCTIQLHSSIILSGNSQSRAKSYRTVRWNVHRLPLVVRPSAQAPCIMRYRSIGTFHTGGTYGDRRSEGD